MANTKIDLAELFRQIQSLNLNTNLDPEKEMKIDFYRTLFSTFCESLDSRCYQSIIPISFKICPLDKAQQYALQIGFHIVECSTQTYLSLSKNLEP